MAADADFNPERMVEEGLQLYSRGELDAALTRWRAVLEREPENHRAREYLRYVEDNRAALEESFQLARQQSSEPKADPEPVEPVTFLSAELPDEPAVTIEPSAEKLRPAEANTPVALADGRLIVETSREVLEVTPPITPLDTPDSLRLSDGGESGLDFEPAGAPPKRVPSTGPIVPDPSFAALADEIARTAQRISEEIPVALPSRKPAGEGAGDDFTPRLDLGSLKAKVAESKRRLTQEQKAQPREPKPAEAPAPPPAAPAGGGTADWAKVEVDVDLDEDKPADAPTAPVLITKASTIPGPPPRVDEPSISSRPTPSGGTGKLGAPETSVPGRSRRPTPLSLIEGGAGKVDQDFEPLEATPVAQKIPRPARLVAVPERDSGSGLLEKAEEDDGGAAVKEMVRDSRTPAKLSRTPKPVTIDSLTDEAPLFDDDGSSRKAATNIGLGPNPYDGEERRTPTPVGAEKLDSLLESARQLHEQGTFEGSLWLCERVLTMDSACREAQTLLKKNQQVLLKQYRRQLGDGQAVPVVQIPQHEIMWHKLDHRAGFLLSRIDGQLSFDDLLDVSGMSEFEACRILSQLMSQGVIGPRR